MRIIIYEDYHMILIFWQRTARVLGFQKMFGLFGLNHHILEKTCDVTPVTVEERRRGRKMENRAVFWENRNRNSKFLRFRNKH